mgnify:CR=1 FL=1
MYPFSSEKKRMSSIIALGDGKYRIFTKGASEIVLYLCSSILESDGCVVPLDPNIVRTIEKQINQYATEGTF